MTMQSVTIKTTGDRRAASAQALASDYKWRRFERHLAWDQFVIDRDLKPEMNAKDFYNLFDSAYSCPFYTVLQVAFTPTHIDTIADLNVPCSISGEGKPYNIVWANGMTGTEFAPLNERFVKIEPQP